VAAKRIMLQSITSAATSSLRIATKSNKNNSYKSIELRQKTNARQPLLNQ
jgi:hypothetical protein